jgi:hypothetical protein
MDIEQHKKVVQLAADLGKAAKDGVLGVKK